jgi:hypothetical protein
MHAPARGRKGRYAARIAVRGPPGIAAVIAAGLRQDEGTSPATWHVKSSRSPPTFALDAISQV